MSEGASAEARPSNFNIANALTVLRILMVPVFAWLLLAESGDDTVYRVAAFVVFLLAMVTDRVDGELARRRGLITDFGKIADPIADKALTGMAFVGLSIIGELWWWVTIVVLVREWGITLMRFWVIRRGVIAASRGGKIKTVLQTVALAMYIFPLPDWGLWAAHAAMAATVAVTVVTGLDYIRQAFTLRRDTAEGS